MPLVGRSDRYRHLYDALDRLLLRHERRDFVILELGTCRCRSALELIRRARRRAADVRYYGFDLFDDATPEKDDEEWNVKRPMTYREALDTLQTTGAEVRLYRGDTRQTLPLAARTLADIDFAFVDGGHSLETIRSDWRVLQTIMAQTGVVVFDDYYLGRDDVGCRKVIVDDVRSPWRARPLGDVYEFPATGPMQMYEVTRCNRSS